jgi:hypothetical protein
VINLDRTSGEPRTVPIITSVTPEIRDQVFQLAESEELLTSEWIRNLILAELKKNNLLPPDD